MTWDEIGRDSLEAAKLLREAGRHRSSVSRAYYAAYARMTAAVEGVATFPKDREGPDHDDLPDLAFDCLTQFSYRARQRLRTDIRQLYDARLYADYRPSHVVGKAEAVQSLMLADRLFREVDNYYA